MGPAEIAMVTTILELVAKYGVPYTMQAIQKMNIENPTPADWEALKVQSASEKLTKAKQSVLLKDE